MSIQPKSVEARCRRAAQRRGYFVRKDRQRDPLGLNYGQWYLYSQRHNSLLAIFKDLPEMVAWFGVEP
jgi:hypothetical protein